MSLHAVFERRRSARLATRLSPLALSPRPLDGFWTRDLVSSPSATAAAVSALVVAEQHFDDVPQSGPPLHDSWSPAALFRGEFMQLVVQNLQWLAERQNDDGGWADAEGGRSSLSATLLVEAAFQLTGVPAKSAGLLDRASQFVDAAGGVAAFRAQHADAPALQAAVLTSCALADIASWKRVPSLSWRQLATLVRGRELKPAPQEPTGPLLAAALAKFRHAPPINPLRRAAMRLVQTPALKVLEGLQGVSGGFAESIPQTSFVVMSLAAAGLQEHAVVRRGVEFLLTTVNSSGGWPSRRAAA